MSPNFVTCVMLTTHPKRAAFLDDAVRSYRAQTHPRRELLVVNDGPQPLRSTASDVRVINLPAPMSIGEKRNVGLRFAYGGLIATWANVFGRCRRERRSVMPSALIRRDTMIRTGGYSDAAYLEDFEMLERFRTLTRTPVVVMPSEWYVMRRHGNNVTLGFGESSDEWIACALRDPDRDAAQAGVDAIRALPVGGLE